LTLDGKAGCEVTCRDLSGGGVDFPTSPVVAIERQFDGVSLTLADGSRMTFDVIYPVLGCAVRSELGTALGARHDDVGCLEVDAHHQTAVPGLYAIGDRLRPSPDRGRHRRRRHRGNIQNSLPHNLR